jgi:hypothetical protein
MLNKIANFFLFRKLRAKLAKNKFLESITSEVTEEFLELLLKAMSLITLIDRRFRRNIENFNARYLFKSRDNSITVGVVFKDNRMKVYEKNIDGTNVTLIFRNQKALRDFLLSPKPDILGGMLRQDVTFDGNLNHLYKFAFMANHLKLMATGKI